MLGTLVGGLIGGALGGYVAGEGSSRTVYRTEHIHHQANSKKVTHPTDKVRELLKDESLLEGNLLELKEAKCLSIS